MAEILKIDGSSFTYGLRVTGLQDYYNLPQRKKILEEPGFVSGDIILKEKDCTVELFGRYVSYASLEASINGLKTKLQDGEAHTFQLTNHGLTFTGICTDGMEVKVRKKTAQVTVKITIVE